MFLVLIKEEKKLISLFIFVLDEVINYIILVWDEGFNIYSYRR